MFKREEEWTNEEFEKWCKERKEEIQNLERLHEEMNNERATPEELRKIDKEMKKNHAPKGCRVPADRKYPILNNVLAWQITIFVAVLINFVLQLAIAIQRIYEKWFW